MQHPGLNYDEHIGMTAVHLGCLWVERSGAAVIEAGLAASGRNVEDGALVAVPEMTASTSMRS